MREQRERRGPWRSRWAAVGAAVAVTLGAGGLFMAEAAEQSSVVPTDPVRIVDTRIDLGITGQLESLVPQDVQVTGMIPTGDGPATAVPSGANGILLNVTVIKPSTRGFVSIRPGGATGLAETSSLNLLAGETMANAVTVEVPTTGPGAGMINVVFEGQGMLGPTTHIAIDVVGYTTNETLASLVSRVDDLEAKAPASATAKSFGDTSLTGIDAIVQTVQITAPADGQVIVNSFTRFYNNDFVTDRVGRCSISPGAVIENDYAQRSLVPAGSAGSGTNLRSYDVTAGEVVTANLVCERQSGSELFQALDPAMTAIFIAS